MKLCDLERFTDIVVQLHDNPDADAVGSGYALYRYFESKGKNVRLIYGGSMEIHKSNILLMVSEMKIPVEYVTELEKPELLITVDCQYGEGNLQHFEAENVAIIDHHNTGKVSDEMTEIRGHIASCATVCYDMLRKEGFDVNQYIDISTALYYGLYMDSNGLSELRHPLDRDMIEDLKVDRALISRLTHANFTLEELEVAGMAMLRYSYDEKRRLSLIKAKPCDPNILGLIGDFILQVDSVDVSVIFNECAGGYKLSVRSCIVEVAANELVGFLTEEIGNGGGHLDKAGGFISRKKYEMLYGDQAVEGYLFKRIDEYYASYDIIYADDGIDTEGFMPYRKLPHVYGYVRTSDLFEEGTEFRVRTYEGDVYITAEKDIYLMIGLQGEVYPLEKDVFEKKYTAVDKPFTGEFDYEPSVMNFSDNKPYEIIPYAKQCISGMGPGIYAKQITKPLKLFTKWDYETYMYGVAGDYMCYTADDMEDAYLVKKEIFEATYTPIDESEI